MFHVVREDLSSAAYKLSTGHFFTVGLKKKRKQKSKEILIPCASAKQKNIMKKIFYIDEQFNKQNNRMYARSSKEAFQVISNVQKYHHPV